MPYIPAINDGVLRLNDKKHLNINSIKGEILELLGYDTHDFLTGALDFSSLIHKDDNDIAQALFKPSSQITSQDINFRCRHKQGHIICLKACYEKHLSADGQEIILTLKLFNAKALKQPLTKDILLNNFIAMMENSDDYIYFKDRNHVFTGASQTLVSITNPSEHWNDLIDLTDYDVFPESYADAYYHLEKKIFSGDLDAVHEVQQTLDNNNQKGWVDNRKYPIKNTQGEIIGLFGIARDITKAKQDALSLQQSEQRYHHLFENSLTEIYIFDAKSYKFIKVNNGACRNLGYSHSELTNLTPIDLKPRLNLKKFNTLIQPLLNNTQEIVHFETLHQRKDGSQYDVEVHLQLTDFLDKPAFIAIILDISERKIAERNLKLSAKVFSETKEGITITDANANIIEVNNALCNMSGYSRDELVGNNPRLFKSNRQNKQFYEEMWQSLNEKGFWQGQLWSLTKDKQLYAELLSISSIFDHHGEVTNYIGISTDITFSKKQQEKLEHIAHYDPLTHLPNRILLRDRFEHILAHSQRQKNLLAICFIDLDCFKPVNDQYGHHVGDLLLIQVAKRIVNTIREEDTASRQGGDEFILLLGDIKSVEQCQHLLNRLIRSLAQPYTIKPHKISISASIGVTLCPPDDKNLDILIRHADHAMYHAKQIGRNQYFLFNIDQDTSIIQKYNQLQTLEQALKNEEFRLYYQPKVNIKTGKVYGAEALIRSYSQIWCIALLSGVLFLIAYLFNPIDKFNPSDDIG